MRQAAMQSERRGCWAARVPVSLLARLLALACVFAAIAAHAEHRPMLRATPAWSIVLHGGAGVSERRDMSPEREAAYREGLHAALDAGSAVLKAGGSAADAVQAAIELMEDNPLFNAGRGAVFTAQGRNELDAAIMSGDTLKAGAVAGVTRTRHPIALARAVMDHSAQVMLIGEGADAYSAAQGLEQVEPSFFFTEERWQQLESELRREGQPLPPRPAGVPRLNPRSSRWPRGRPQTIDSERWAWWRWIGPVIWPRAPRPAVSRPSAGGGSATRQLSVPVPTPPMPRARCPEPGPANILFA